MTEESSSNAMRSQHQRGPSLELQRQIDEAIAARSNRQPRSSHAQTRSTIDTEGSSSEESQVSELCQVNTIQETSTSSGLNSTKTSDQHSETIIHEPGVPPPNSCFEYLNHPADIILHSWGDDLPSSLSNLALCMFGYITSLEAVSVSSEKSLKDSLRYGRGSTDDSDCDGAGDSVAENSGQKVRCSGFVAKGHDLYSLIYNFLDGWLWNFFDTGFIPREIDIIEFSPGGNNTNPKTCHKIKHNEHNKCGGDNCDSGERKDWSIRSCGRGEVMDISRHPQGTEVKAVTYNGMRVGDGKGRCDIYVVVDI